MRAETTARQRNVTSAGGASHRAIERHEFRRFNSRRRQNARGGGSESLRRGQGQVDGFRAQGFQMQVQIFKRFVRLVSA